MTTPSVTSPNANPIGEPSSSTLADAAWWRWILILGVAAAVLLWGAPAGITPQAWRLFAIFLATIVGSILRPVPAGAIVLFGVCAIALSGALTPAEALRGYADPLVWLVLCAFFIARGLIKTGLGRRIAFLFIRALGGRSLGLAYALVGTDVMLASIIPSNTARAGGVIFPIVRSLAEAYDSTPGATARRLGAFLMKAVYQCDVIACAMFLTGQVSNVLIARFARDVTGVDLTYSKWLIGGIVPGIVSLLVVPYALYKLYPPEITHTPQATALARDELRRMGRMSRGERMMLFVFALVGVLWMTTAWHGINYTVVALLGISILLLSGVLAWDDVLSERPAWDVYILYGGLVMMAQALGETGITKRFAESAASVTVGWAWWWALAVLALTYFYAHYGFASITAHATAMFTPFLIVIIAAGAPPQLAVLSLAYATNLDASLTNYGTTTAPIYFGARYVSQRDWWRLGFLVSLMTITIWGTLGVLWWKVLGWW